MHETGLVRILLQQVEEIAKSRNGQRILEIRVETGPLSGVEPCLLQSAYEREVAGIPDPLRPNGIDFSSAHLQIDEIPIEATCERCGNQFEVHDFRFLCPLCGSGAVIIVRGDSLRLMTVTIEGEVDRQDAL